MYGAIIGDIAGSRFEWTNIKTTEFEIFTDKSIFTDDSVMTFAIAESLDEYEDNYEDDLSNIVIDNLRKYCLAYPKAGYGRLFKDWLNSENPQPYGSYGNGSAMRVSQVGWKYNDLSTVEKIAEITAAVTHNDPEGIKGAKVIAGCIYLARTTKDKEKIRQYVLDNGYSIQTCDEIRPTYKFDATCQGTIPAAISAFLEGNSFEEVLRLGVSLGGDSDTLTCIACSIAEAIYPIPEEFKVACRARLDNFLLEKLDKFDMVK